MKYIGNFIDQIPAGLIEAVLNDPGDVTPVYQPEKWNGKPEWDAARIALEDAGYPTLDYHFHQYTQNTECIKPFLDQINFKFNLPNLPPVHHWWIVKYMGGDMQPMHFDPHIIDTQDCQRYTMMLTDFEDGHIFVYDNVLLNNYKAGDLFLWPDAMILHGAANISMHPRVSLQMSFYNEICR